MIQLEHLYEGIEIQVFKNGVPAAADATPTAVLFRNGTLEAVGVDVVSTAYTGRYLGSFTTLSAGAGWSEDDHLVMLTTAVIDALSYPTTSFDSLGIPGSKTGYTLSAVGLDAIGVSDPVGVPTTLIGRLNQMFMEMFYRKKKDDGDGTIQSFAADSVTVVKSRDFTSAGGVDDVDKAV